MSERYISLIEHPQSDGEDDAGLLDSSLLHSGATGANVPLRKQPQSPRVPVHDYALQQQEEIDLNKAMRNSILHTRGAHPKPKGG